MHYAFAAQREKGAIICMPTVYIIIFTVVALLFLMGFRFRYDAGNELPQQFALTLAVIVFMQCTMREAFDDWDMPVDFTKVKYCFIDL